jgi:hypothetical protein
MTQEQTIEVPTTALVHVRPDANAEVVALYSEGVKALEWAQLRVICDDLDVKIATDDLSVISTRKKVMEEQRKSYTGPLNDHLKMVNEAFKRFMEPWNQADVLSRSKILTYRAEQERQRQEQERINRLREEVARAEMELKGEISEPVGLVQVAEEAPARYRTDTGTTGTAKIKKWEVVDLKLVPLEYMMIDASKVGKVVRAGIPSIPGIRIWEEEGLRITPRT